MDLFYEYLDTKRFIDRGIPTGTDGLPVEAFADIVFGDAEQNYSELEASVIKATLENKFSDTLKGRQNDRTTILISSTKLLRFLHTSDHSRYSDT